MDKLQDLTTLIMRSGSDAAWDKSQWDYHLTKSIPDWREIFANPESWETLEKALPHNNYYLYPQDITMEKHTHYDEFCELALEVAGYDLARRWYNASVLLKQKEASIRWLRDNLLEKALDAVTWNTLPDELKDVILEFAKLHASLRLEKLRETIAEAKDQKYTDKINSMFPEKD